MSEDFKPTVLGILRCQKTGLKYFCKTTKEDKFDTYKGSGKDWKGIVTESEILWVSAWFYEKEKVKRFATLFSKINNIVESNEWANRKIENGLDGGSDSSVYTKKVRQKMSKAKKKLIAEKGTDWASHPHSKESKLKMSIAAKERCKRDGAPSGAFKKGNIPINKGIPATKEQRLKNSITAKMLPKIECIHCKKKSNPGNYKRWHGDNCKEIK